MCDLSPRPEKIKALIFLCSDALRMEPLLPKRRAVGSIPIARSNGYKL